jgi:hypothetical protein
MKKQSRSTSSRRPKTPGYFKALKWAAVAAVVVGVGYGVSQMGGVAYNEDAIKVVDFSELNPAQKRSALQAANGARCSCGCGLTLAECVATDSTCPIRETNIDRIKGMVREARNK